MGSQLSPASSREPALGERRRLGCPRPPVQRAGAHSPDTDRQKDRQPANKGEGEEPLHPQPSPGGKETGVFLPGASALRSAPRPWAPPPDRRTAGQWAPGRSSGRPGRGSPGLGPGRRRAASSQAGGGEPRGGAADGQSQRQTDRRRGKRWRRGRRERAARAPAASGARARASPLSLPPSPGWSPSPLPRRAPGGVGGALEERGSGEAGLKGVSNHRCVRGGLASILAPRGPPSLASSLVFLQPRQPHRSRILSWTCELRPDSQLRYWFLTPPLSSATKPTSPNHTPQAPPP